MPIFDPASAPASAFQLTGGAVAFEAASAPGDTIPVRLLARTGQPIEHAYWGRIVHDLSGVQAKETVPLDHRHDPYQVIGFGKAAVESGDLWVSGALVPFQSDDVAAEIAYKASRGVPYEASIDFRGQGIVLEELGVGAKAKVNGYTLEGPAVIVRKWPLRAVAICECGADPGTKAQFSDEFLSLSDVADRWGLSPRTVRRVVDRGELVATKLGGSVRIPVESLVQYEALRRRQFRNAVGSKLSALAASIHLPQKAALPDGPGSAAREQRMRKLGHSRALSAFAGSLELPGRRGQ